MIGGATRGAGGPALGTHLADRKRLNEETRAGTSRGLVSEGIRDRVAELTDIAGHARSRRPLYHVHADPPEAWSEERWDAYWIRFEREFGLESQPFAEAAHVKHGREHRHRVYSLVTGDGSCIRMDHDYARREKIHRLVELETGGRLTPGRHNRAVIQSLEREGRADAAAAMRDAGLDTMARPEASTTPPRRAQAERTGVAPGDVGAAALAAWRTSDSGPAFRAALVAYGLELARGDRVPVLVDASGNALPLARLLGKASKDGGDRIAASAVTDRLVGMDLPRHRPGARSAMDPAPAIVATTIADTSETAVAIRQVPPPAAPTVERDHQHHGGQDGHAAADSIDEHLGPNARESGHPGVDSPDTEPGHGPEQADRAGQPSAAGEAVEPGSDPRRPGRDGGPGAPAGDGPQGDERGDVRYPAGGGDHGRPPGAPVAPGTAGGAGGDSARPDPRAPAADRGGPDPDRAADARRRIRARRESRSLATAVGQHGDRLAELTAALRHPPTAASLVHEALASSDERTRHVLATEPWTDAANRSVARVSGSLRDEARERQRGREAAAEEAAAGFEAARARVGLLDRVARLLGMETSAVRDAREAERRVLQAESERAEGHDGLREECRGTDAAARSVVESRERERVLWECRPDVVAAHREARGNELLRVALAEGDEGVTATAVLDLSAARRIVLHREAGSQWRAENEDRLLQEEDALRQGTFANDMEDACSSMDGWPPGWRAAGR